MQHRKKYVNLTDKKYSSVYCSVGGRGRMEPSGRGRVCVCVQRVHCLSSVFSLHHRATLPELLPTGEFCKSVFIFNITKSRLLHAHTIKTALKFIILISDHNIYVSFIHHGYLFFFNPCAKIFKPLCSEDAVIIFREIDKTIQNKLLKPD